MAENGGAELGGFSILDEFERRREDPEVAIAVAVIRALTTRMKQSEATTTMGLEKDLREASTALKLHHKTSISLSAACDLFLRYVTRGGTLESATSFEVGRARLIERGEQLGALSLKARETIAAIGQEFIADGSVVLIHGFSRAVLAVCQMAAARGKNFRVICTEGRPDNAGVRMATSLTKCDVPVTLVLDAAVGFVMERVSMVLVGAEGVMENGGIVNKLGTYQVAIVAKSRSKPVYAAAESYKFARMYPLDQQDIEPLPLGVDFNPTPPASVKIENSQRDYTPPEYLSLLFTDLGVLTPAGAIDELFRLYL
eukprot:TRINITY_DN36065_c0_g1_i1.p1 TRINITY_DN36065_c0_g1~~TRINITY_DN36065_c0_g1_i1.p1  ORF type:complete len:313 (-),score=63.31 TRINITY_DN36065_c0_g1_i1:262-1200(-)